MWSVVRVVLPILIWALSPCYVLRVNSSVAYRSALRPRNYVTETTLADSYDFVVAGGGLAGLVIASRLSEDANKTVLVIEAGETGEAVEDSINVPSATYYNSLVKTSYDWQHQTTLQEKAGGRVLSWPRGKVLGGSTAINGMYYVRPSQIEVDAWKGLLEQNDDNAGTWGWDNLHAAMKKSETFTPPSADAVKVVGDGNIRFDPSSYGATGPLHVTYPGFMYSIVGDWTPSLSSLGIEVAADPAGGKNFGGFVSTVSINPSNWTRAYSREAYIDPISPRRNLDVLVSATVTRVIFNGGNDSAGLKVASRVEFAMSKGGVKRSVGVGKEVVVVGGALGSPNILMQSGVGPKDVLEGAGVPVVVELPGVGQHLQDHLAAPVVWESKVETPGDIQKSGSDFSKLPLTNSFINSAIAYINASTLFNHPDSATSMSEFADSITSAMDTSVRSLVPSRDAEVVEGYKAIYSTTQGYVSGQVGMVELLLSINAPGSITVQAALQHPFSQGRVYINSSSAFDPIVINPQYFSHPADIQVLREGIKLVRRLGQAAPLSNALGAETYPGKGVVSDEDIEAWLRGAVATEFHPQATCAMLPRAKGGVVDGQLRVYGLANVRVADSSVFPLSFSAHLSSATYGLAEKAADLIKATYQIKSDDNSPQGSNNGAPPPGEKTGENGAALGVGRLSFGGVAVAAFALILAVLVL